MLASSGPKTQSWALTGGKMERSVGPGVGLGLTTVHPAGCSVATTSTRVAGTVTVFAAVGAGGEAVWSLWLLGLSIWVPVGVVAEVLR